MINVLESLVELEALEVLGQQRVRIRDVVAVTVLRALVNELLQHTHTQ